MSPIEQTTLSVPSVNWDGLSSTLDEQFYQNWLELQCSMVADSYAALLVVQVKETNEYKPVALWPDDATHLQHLSELVEHVIEDGSGYISTLPAESHAATGNAYGVAYPVVKEGELYAVVAMAVVVASEKHLQRAMRQLQWGSSWVELFSLRNQSVAQKIAHKRLTAGVGILSKVLAERESAAASLRLVTELAILFNCERVSIGFEKKRAIHLDQMSHSAQFGKRMNIIRAIESAMDEAVDQREVLRYPEDDNHGGVTMAHAALANQRADVTIMSIPLFSDNEVLGVITLERDAETPFNQYDADYCESIASLAIMALAEKRENDKALLWKMTDALRLHLRRFIGPGYPGRKLIAIILVMFVLFASLVDGTYRLSADATLENYFQRALVAPYDGFIKSAPLRAGDVVKEGDLIASLDDKDLRLERLKWLSQRAQLKGQSLEATAAHDRVKITVTNAQLEQALAQLELVESQLERAEIRAPFYGLIVSGDMSQRLGGAIGKGEVLFEISPLNAYRINLQVKESRIADVRVGQHGVLHLSALPETSYEFVVDKLTTVTRAADGANFFHVEAILRNVDEQMRPGMEGVGQIEINQRRLISIWSRELMEWLRLKLWAWWS